MGNLDVFKTNAAAEVEGVWVKYPGTDIELRVARLWNHRMTNAFIAMQREAGSVELDSDELSTRGKLLARTVLLDWRNVQRDGQELVYTPDLGEMILCDANYHELASFVTRTARDRERFLFEAAETTRKN